MEFKRISRIKVIFSITLRAGSILILWLLITCPCYTQEKTADPKAGQSKQQKSAEKIPTELDEAEAYLNEVKNNFLNLKIYTLAGTDRSDISPEIADRVIAEGTGAIRLQKLSEKVLMLHKLTEVCSTVLFQDEKPRVFTYRLRSISFSSGIFDLLTDDEAVALIAHEAGHLYVAKELSNARTNDDDRLARVNELKCDVIALLTLKSLGIEPKVLTKALKKLITARKNMNLQTDTAQSPLLKDRERIVQIFTKIH